MIHDFKTSLALSQSQADAPWWEPVYRAAFHNFACMAYIRKDGWAQRGGVDRVITLDSGKEIKVDEKVRSIDYPDILLEFWSDRKRRIPGWVAKDLACDFIAYAFIPSKTCHLLPFLTLRRAWQINGRNWIRRFGVIKAHNNGWTTESVPVPVEELTRGLIGAMTVNWATGVVDPPDSTGGKAA